MELEQNPDVRSFVLRQGRLTPGQKAAFDSELHKYALDWQNLLPESNWPSISQPCYLEIGFGNGESLHRMAQANPSSQFVGIEVHSPGVGHLLVQLKNAPLTNLKIISNDAVAVLDALPEHSLAGLHIYFPDPWPKKKHHKRRLIQPWLVNKVLPKLTADGYIHVATDWQPYAEHILAVLESTPALYNASLPDFARPVFRPETKFEKRGERRGHPIADLIFARSQTPQLLENK